MTQRRLAEYGVEAELVVACARVALTPAAADRIGFLASQNLDWRIVRQIVLRNRVELLLYRHLRQVCPQQVPPARLEYWEQLNRATAIQNLILTNGLLSVIDLLQEHDIEVIPYKGPVLAQMVYGNLSLRQFGDLDVIVNEADALRAKELLCADGFTVTWPEIPLQPRQERQHIAHKYNFTLERETDKIELELHWAVANRYLDFPPDPLLLWQNLATVTVAGRTLHTFQPEVQLLVLCVHGSNHCWNRLSWVCDIAEICRRYPVDWSYLLQTAREWHAQRMLFIGLQLAASLLEVPLPPQVQQAILADTMAVYLAQQSRKWMFHPEFLPFAPLEEPAYHLRMLDRRRNRLNYVLEMIKPSAKDWAFVDLPPVAGGLYYLIRPLRLLVEHGISLRAGAGVQPPQEVDSAR